MIRKLTDDQERELADRYLRGEMFDELAKAYGICTQTVYNTLNKFEHVSAKKHQKALLAKKIVKACSNGAIIAEVAAHTGVSESTIDRILRKHRASGSEVTLRRGRPPITRTPLILKQRSAPRKDIDPAKINEIYEHLRRVPFPFPPQCENVFFNAEVLRLQNQSISVDKHDTIYPWSATGSKICIPFFPNRYRGIRKGSVSAWEAWHDETLMKKAIRLQLRYGNPTEPHRVLRAITLDCRTPGIFRPSTAQFIYKTYCPPGGRVWDPCSGYGGRLLGAFAAGVHYTGTDVDTETVTGNRQLAERLGANYDVIVAPAETFNPPKVDLVFTSPPYFDRERYSNNENQTWKKYGTNIDAWLAGFLHPVIERSHTSLRASGHLILNIANLNEQRAVIPLVDRTIATAIEAGFVHVRTLQMPLAAFNKTNPTEPVLIFQPR